VESDPIGLRGGVSTFGYSAGNPIIYFDPFGLTVYHCSRGMDVFSYNNRGIPHDYVCASSPFPGMDPICCGHGPSPGFKAKFYGLGAPTPETYMPGRCTPTPQGRTIVKSCA